MKGFRLVRRKRLKFDMLKNILKFSQTIHTDQVLFRRSSFEDERKEPWRSETLKIILSALLVFGRKDDNMNLHLSYLRKGHRAAV